MAGPDPAIQPPRVGAANKTANHNRHARAVNHTNVMPAYAGIQPPRVAAANKTGNI